MLCSGCSGEARTWEGPPSFANTSLGLGIERAGAVLFFEGPVFSRCVLGNQRKKPEFSGVQTPNTRPKPPGLEMAQKRGAPVSRGSRALCQAWERELRRSQGIDSEGWHLENRLHVGGSGLCRRSPQKNASGRQEALLENLAAQTHEESTGRKTHV